ncbi:MAG: signal peptidase I [Lentisphaerae bacterium]|nr:signal peptidase I [Lentisphaerota bacterium]
MAPPRTFAALRENVEVLVVAVVVAMAFRTYFIQPFKIPTSSMYPTLHGIHFRAFPGPGVTDRWPLKLGKWLIFGDWYVEIKARQTGVVRPHQTQQGLFLLVNDVPHKVHENMHFHVVPGQTVYRGQLLASAIRTAGDHIFVNRLIWHFRRPRRGEIMVFTTTGIEHPQIKKNEHYVKRMVGLPGEELRIVPPRLLINGQPVRHPSIMQHIQQGVGDYHGYVDSGDFLEACHGTVSLGPRDYFACGDNQNNSLDSRYWGPVDRMNLVGPTFFVYWPISRRWGLAR